MLLAISKKDAIRRAAFGFFLFLGAMGSTRAQQAPSPLTGKIIHLYDPFNGAQPQVDLSGTGYDMPHETGNWYKFEFSSVGGSLQPWMNSFGIRTSDWHNFGPNGLGGSTSVWPESTTFKSASEIWIMVDPSGPDSAAPQIMTAPPKTVHVLNPWPINGPAMILSGKRVTMLADKENCGWYFAYILNGAASGYFASVADNQSWGKGGFDDPTPFDFTSLFASKGPDLWIVSQTEFYGANPGKLGTCTYEMAATVHDMAEAHPDYGDKGAPGGAGMVQTTLGPDHKPVGTSAAPGHFSTWFNTDPNAAPPLKGAETCVNLEMGKADDGLWYYDSYDVPKIHSFFPIDDFNTLDQNTGPSCYEDPSGGFHTAAAGDVHNFGFCMESHANFKYQRGQVFDFRGDDDVWVFINNKMVLDIGGVHTAKPGSVKLDTLGLTEGQTYPWDFFFCERKKCGSSLRIKTTIYFKQQRALDHADQPLPGGGTSYKVIKRIGGTGACGSSGDSLKEVAPGPLTFVLYQVGGDSIQELPKSTVSFGGINVGDGSVTVDTNKVAGLAPGQYRIVFYETASPRLRDEVRFTVLPHNVVELDPPYTVEATVGTVVKVVAANRFRDSLVAAAAPWVPIFPAGLSAFSDSGRTAKVVSGVSLTTAATGLDTLWLMGDPAATTDQTYTVSIPGSQKSVKVTFKLPPIDLPKAVSAALYDDDGDGRGDRLEVTYDRDISASLPKAMAYRWPSSNATDSSLGTDFASKLQGTTTLVFRGKALSAGILTAGDGVVKSTYAARGKDSTQSIPIQDKMGPVLRTATMHLGQSYDTLQLDFSEPLAPASRAANPGDLFGYKLGDSAAVVSIAPHDAVWAADGSAVSLTFPSSSTPEPKAGDFVRLNDGPGLAADAAGNRPGPQTRFHPITGDRRTGILTVTYREVVPDPALSAEPTFKVSLEASGADVKTVVDRTGRMGHLLQLELADYAVGDGVTVPEPSQVALNYSVALFTNLGVPVASEKRVLLCTDAVFQGDCRAHRGRVFVGWNYTSATRAKIATGAYVALFDFKVKVQGKTEASGNLKQIWGLLRKG
jgi:fibro-slime domain-containing protein